MTELEYDQVLQKAKDLQRERVVCLLLFAHDTGIPISKLTTLTVDDLDKKSISIKDKEYIIPDDVKMAVKNYCQNMQRNDGIIFRTKTGRTMDRKALDIDVRNVAKKCVQDPGKVTLFQIRKLYLRTQKRLERNAKMVHSAADLQ